MRFKVFYVLGDVNIGSVVKIDRALKFSRINKKIGGVSQNSPLSLSLFVGIDNGTIGNNFHPTVFNAGLGF